MLANVVGVLQRLTLPMSASCATVQLASSRRRATTLRVQVYSTAPVDIRYCSLYMHALLSGDGKYFLRFGHCNLGHNIIHWTIDGIHAFDLCRKSKDEQR